MPQKQMECFRLLLEHLAWIEHRFLSSIRDSRKAGSLWGMRSVGGVRTSIDQSWLAKGLGLGLLCWGFQGVQEEILSEEASTLQNATEMYGMLQTAFGASWMNCASVFAWHKIFKEGRESVRDNERCGRSKEVNRPELIDQRVRLRVRVTMLRF